MPVADAVAALPWLFHDFVWCSTLHVPYECLLHLLAEYLAKHHGVVGTLVSADAVVVHVCCYFQSCIADGIEWQHRHVEVYQVGVVPVDGVEGAVVEV